MTIVVILAIDGLVVGRVVLCINTFVVVGKFRKISVVIISRLMVADFFDIVMRCISWQSSNDWVVSGPVVMGVVRMAWLLLLVMVVSFLVRIVMGCFLMVIIFMDSSIVRLLVISMVLRGSMMSTINFMPVFSLRLNLMMLNMVHVLTMIVVVRFTLVTRLMMRFVMGLMMRFVMGLMMGRFVMVIDCFRVGMEM